MKEIVPCEGGGAAQKSCGCPIAGSVPGQAGRGLEALGQWEVSLGMAGGAVSFRLQGFLQASWIPPTQSFLGFWNFQAGNGHPITALQNQEGFNHWERRLQRTPCIFLCPELISMLQWQIPPQPWPVGLGGGISTLTQEARLGVCNDFFLLAKILLQSLSLPTSWEPSPEGEIPYDSPINSTFIPVIGLIAKS